MRRTTPLALGAVAALVTAGALQAPALGVSHARPATAPHLERGPEDPAELQMKAADLTARHLGRFPVADQAYATEMAHAAELAAQAAKAPSQGTWKPVGIGALQNDDPTYPQGTGLKDASGRVEKIAFDPLDTTRWFAATASGGIWETRTSGASWTLISKGVPTQQTGAVEYLPTAAKGVGTIIVGTGDPAVGAPALPGLGAWWSEDDGATWHKAGGVPDGATSYRVAFDKGLASPSTVYLATNRGLYRSDDRGHSFANVVLPTGCTDIANPRCFFANFVTDVSVQATGGVAGSGGAVVAGIGWRYGMRNGVDGKPLQPNPGLYRSATGAVGSFQTYEGSTTNGFPADSIVGRIALGSAYGPKQDHRYLYAAVADASRGQNLNGPQDAPIPALPDPTGDQATVKAVANSTVLKGIYGSKDFGLTWTLLADAEQLKNPATHSALNGYFSATGYSPGIQAWYNLFIQPDPYRVSTDPLTPGAPSFLAFGLEEVWGGEAAIKAPNSNVFQVFGKYFAGDACFGGLTVANPSGYCPTTVDPLKPDPSGFTVHPDQHAITFIPTGGTETVVVGNDGGLYSQVAKESAPSDAGTIPGRQSEIYDNASWRYGLNKDLYTLLPYDANMARDGVTFAGLQDNGTERIGKDGKQSEVYGGDGFYVAVDPSNSNVAWEEYTYGATRYTNDGGRTWTTSTPTTAGSSTTQFSNPFTMDPFDAKHLLAGGRQVTEKLNGTTASTGWTTVFDLGTASEPGSAIATAADSSGRNTNNLPTAVDLRGDTAYVGYCSLCDPIKTINGFTSGIATNVGGTKPARKGSGDGWHIAKAQGLPERLINGVTVDPTDPRTVYVGLGGYVRQWVRPGAFGEDTSKLGDGVLYVSHDAGETFTDITGNLPKLPADATIVHDGDLIVGTDAGAYVLPDVAAQTKPGATPRYTALVNGLDQAAVFSLEISPRNGDEIVAGTYGRGVQSIVLSPGSNPTSPSSGVKKPGKKAKVKTVTGPRGSLAATGQSVGLPVLAGLLVAAGASLARRRRLRA